MRNLSRRNMILASIGAVAAAVGATAVAPQNVLATHFVVCDGDSLTYGYEMPRQDTYPAQLQVLLGYQYKVRNLGMNGQTLNQMLASAPDRADDIFHLIWQKKYLVAWGGTNDMYFGDNAQVAYQDYINYCQARQAAGYRVIAMTILPRTKHDTPADFETQREEFNSLVREKWSSFANGLADVAADNRLGDAGDDADKTYYWGDFVHLNKRGYAIVAGIVKAAILTT